MASVLIVGAHPDDAEFGMGGTLLRLLEAGEEVVVVVMTDGGAGSHGTATERRKEMEAAATFAGFSLERLGLGDCTLADDYATRSLLAALIRKHRPRILFAPYPGQRPSHLDGRAHPDHIAAGSAACHACRLARFKGIALEGEPHRVEALYYYMLPATVEATFTVDVSAQMERLEALMERHATQMRLRDGTVKELLLTHRKEEGRHSERFAAAEPVDGWPLLTGARPSLPPRSAP